MANLESRVAVVTGGGSGIGRAIAQGLAADGATVVVADVAAGSASQVAGMLPGAVAATVDVADPVACRHLVDAVVAAHGRLDILVNNAGLQHVAPLVVFPEERWDRLLRVMVDGPFHLTKAALPAMLHRGWGRIINIGSIHSLIASPNKVAYITAKHALLGLTRATAVEVGTHGVTCNLVAPAYVRTPMVESQLADQARSLAIDPADVLHDVMLAPTVIRRLIEPEEVAACVRFLCMDSAASITGSVQVIDGGWTAK